MSKKDFLLQPLSGCRTIVSIGKPHMGKSYIALNSVKEWLKMNAFDHYYMVLPNINIEQNNSYDFLKRENNVTIFTSYHPKIGERLIEEQMNNKHRKIFFMMDDSTKEKDVTFNDKSLLDIATSSRHLRIHTWLIVHAAKAVFKPAVRMQIQFIFIYKVSYSLLETIFKEYVDNDDFEKYDKFLDVFKPHVRGRDYGCILFDNENDNWSTYVCDWFKN